MDHICLVASLLGSKRGDARAFMGELEEERYMESGDFVAALSQFAQSRDEFDLWFKGRFADASASSGQISVTTPAGTATSAAAFSVTLSVTGFSPTSGGVGASVYISGVGFSGVTQVTFNGTPATFTRLGSSFISARVPSGATSGQIAVTTPTATARSAASFTVR